MDGPLLGIIGAVLSFEQRAWLKAFIDFTARQRVAETDPYSPVPRCRGCGIRLSERTPGCHACQSRHAGRRRQAKRFATELRLPSERSRSARARWADGARNRTEESPAPLSSRSRKRRLAGIGQAGTDGASGANGLPGAGMPEHRAVPRASGPPRFDAGVATGAAPGAPA